MRLLIVLVLCASAPARAEIARPWYRGFYAGVGVRDSFSPEEPFHAWAALSYRLGYRFARPAWGLDGSILNFQADFEEGLHTVARLVPYATFTRWTRLETWLGAGLSYGWIQGTVDRAIAKRRGEGLQAELVGGVELPIKLRCFLQGTVTFPFYDTYNLYRSKDSDVYVYALELAIGVRF